MIDYQSRLNREIQIIKPSAIRKFFDIASEMEDVISLSIGEPDFSTPWHIRQEGIRQLDKGRTHYSPNRGFSELRQELCRWFDRHYGVSYQPETECLVTVGGSEAIDLCIRTLINPGDEVLIPEPSYVCYVPMAEMAEGVPVIMETKAQDHFRLTPEELLAHITPKTKLLILPYPNNPTGGVMRREHLEAIAKVVIDHDLLVLSDEIYGELTYGDASHCSMVNIPGMKERTIVVNGFSKAFAMTGWRLGYAMGPKELIAAMTKLHQYVIMSAPTPSQYAAVEALRNGDSDIAYMREQYDMRRRLIVSELNRMGLTCFDPEGAFYVFPSIQKTGLSSDEFCEKLLYEEHVAVVPGTAFGACGEGFVRISYSYSIKHITEALRRIERFVKKYES